MYQVVFNGGFVLVDHVNSTRREEGRDPVHVGSLNFVGGLLLTSTTTSPRSP